MSDLNTNRELVKLFNKLAKLYTLRAAKNDFFRVRSSQNTAQVIENMQDPIESFIDLENEKFKNKISGIGKASEDKIIEFIKTQECEEINELLQIYPQGLLDMMEIKGLGPKKAFALYEKFGVDNIEKLKQILQEPEKLSELSIKEKTIANLKEAIQEEYTNKKRHNISDIYDEIMQLKNECQKLEYVLEVHIAGSFRRLEKTIGDIDIIITCEKKHRQAIIDSYSKLNTFKKIINSGETKVTAILKSSIGVDLRLIDKEQIGSCLQYFTGNRAHNIKIRQIAKDKGWKINEYGLFDENDNLLESQSETKIYELLDLQFVPPTLRSGSQEIEDAQNNNLRFVTYSNLKNELNLDSKKLPPKIFIIQTNKEQAIEKTLTQVHVLGKNPKQKFAFDNSNKELGIQICQKCNIQANQILNCIDESELNKTLEEI